jgi:S-adenosylmethionine:tRNA ribosyltransferase-isomerase
MRVALFDYELDPGSIAQAPLADPESARLFHVGADGNVLRHVRDLPDLLPEGALVIINDTRVLKARILGRKRASGGKAEVFLVRPDGDDAGAGMTARWIALGRASKGMPVGTVVDADDLMIRVVERRDEVLVVTLDVTRGTVAEAIERVGHVPLPPYIRREDDASDESRYQTIFARHPGAVAAPTAGLHLTHGLCERIRRRGCSLASVTLHVGLGTFQPVTAVDLDDHPMHEERFDVPAETALAIASARERGAAVVAIGTTVVRALEAAADDASPGLVRSGPAETRLLIQPGYRFRVVDLLFTNFHLPKSTLLALVAAFGGLARVLGAYREAQRAGLRFFSYGDAMLLEPSIDDRRAP